MSSLSIQGSEFRLTGKLLDFIIKDGYKLKYLRIIVDEREYWIKVPKELRQSLNPAIKPESFLEIKGVGKVDRKTGKLELKAREIELISQNQGETTTSSSSRTQKRKILICQKSDCWRRGGQQICETLQQELNDRGLSETVTIQRTGCLKKCKNAPNLVVLPEKAHYHRVNLQEVPYLLEKHFSQGASDKIC